MERTLMLTALMMVLSMFTWDGVCSDFQRTTGSYVMLKNRATHKCIDVNGRPGTGDGANIQVWGCENPHSVNTDQVWSMDDYGRIHNFVSGKCIDVNGRPGSGNGNNIMLWKCEHPYDSRTDHRWRFIYSSDGNYVQIKNDKSNKCLDVSGMASFSSGKNIQLYDCEAEHVQNSDQWWELVYVTP